MQPVERKQKREWKHGRVFLLVAVLVLLGSSIAAVLLLTDNQVSGVRSQVSEDEVSGVRSQVSGDEVPGDEVSGDEVSGFRSQVTGDSRNGMDEPEVPQERGAILSRSPEEIASVTIHHRGQEPWTIIRNDTGETRLQGAEGWTVKERLANQIQNALANLVYEDIVTEDPAEYMDRLDVFGLEDPYITAEVRFTDGQEITVRLGDEVPVEKQVRYMLIDGDNRLYAAAYSLADDLEVEKEALHPVNQPEIYPVLLDRITVYDRNGKEKAEWRLRGDITDQDAGTNWVITAPFRYPADEEMIRNLKDSAGNLRMGVFLDDATAENLAKWGLAEPEYTLELHMAAGSTGTVSDLGIHDVVEREGGTVVLDIAPGNNEMIYYVRFGEEIYKVSYVYLSALTETKPALTTAHYIAPVPLNSLESMTVEKNGETATYTLERTGQIDPETAEEKIICRKDGEEISREAFEAAYERLLTVTVSGQLPNDAEWGETHTKYAFRTVSGGTHTVELSDWDGMHDAVTMDGETRYYLIKDGAEFTLSQ